MSSDIDFKEQWGQHAQTSFELSLINEASHWEKTDGPLPEFKDDREAQSRHNYGCTVKHHKFNERIVLKKEIWRKFIKNRSWSTLQSLTEKAIEETLQFVDKRYKNSPTVELDLRWTLSVVSKGSASKL